MGLESTISEQDLDASSLHFVQGLRKDGSEAEPDLAVDGLSESILSRLLGILRFGRS
jgi:hypothetical protein